MPQNLMGVSPRKSSPRKQITPKELLKENVDKVSDTLKHIADQLIFLSQNIGNIFIRKYLP